MCNHTLSSRENDVTGARLTKWQHPIGRFARTSLATTRSRLPALLPRCAFSRLHALIRPYVTRSSTIVVSKKFDPVHDCLPLESCTDHGSRPTLVILSQEFKVFIPSAILVLLFFSLLSLAGAQFTTGESIFLSY